VGIAEPPHEGDSFGSCWTRTAGNAVVAIDSDQVRRWKGGVLILLVRQTYEAMKRDD
jgi:hypothetical protein